MFGELVQNIKDAGRHLFFGYTDKEVKEMRENYQKARENAPPMTWKRIIDTTKFAVTRPDLFKPKDQEIINKAEDNTMAASMGLIIIVFVILLIRR